MRAENGGLNHPVQPGILLVQPYSKKKCYHRYQEHYRDGINDGVAQ